jgi:endonuclease YncB( thermonuclease family)
MMRAFITAALTVALMVALMALATPGRAAEAIVTDGDTLILDGVPYRLDGIEAPQTDQTCVDDKGAPWTCGIAARDRLREHVGKRDVRCEDRGADSAYRARRIGVCSIAGEAANINQWMVQEGWALNVDRSAKGPFKADRDSASANRKGLWNGCFVAPESLRRFTISTAALLGAACPKANTWAVREKLFPEQPAMPPGCAIKGQGRPALAGGRLSRHLSPGKLQELRAHQERASMVLLGRRSQGRGLPQVVHVLRRRPRD